MLRLKSRINYENVAVEKSIYNPTTTNNRLYINGLEHCFCYLSSYYGNTSRS